MQRGVFLNKVKIVSPSKKIRKYDMHLVMKMKLAGTALNTVKSIDTTV